VTAHEGGDEHLVVGAQPRQFGQGEAALDSDVPVD